MKIVQTTMRKAAERLHKENLTTIHREKIAEVREHLNMSPKLAAATRREINKLPGAIVMKVVKDERELYESDSNQLRIFKAYQVCRKHDVEIPEWVLEQFDGVADRILDTERSKNMEPRDVAKRVLGITHKKDIAPLEISNRQIEVAEKVVDIILSGNEEKFEPANEEVSEKLKDQERYRELKLSKTKVQRIFKKYRGHVFHGR